MTCQVRQAVVRGGKVLAELRNPLVSLREIPGDREMLSRMSNVHNCLANRLKSLHIKPLDKGFAVLAPALRRKDVLGSIYPTFLEVHQIAISSR